MIDILVIEGRGKGIWKVVLRFDVPDINNAVGINYRAALKNSGRDLTSVLKSGDGTNGTISSADQTLLTDGVVFEHVIDLDLEGPGSTTASQRAILRSAWATEEALTIETLKGRLKYFAHEETKV